MLQFLHSINALHVVPSSDSFTCTSKSTCSFIFLRFSSVCLRCHAAICCFIFPTTLYFFLTGGTGLSTDGTFLAWWIRAGTMPFQGNFSYLFNQINVARQKFNLIRRSIALILSLVWVFLANILAYDL